MSWGLCTYRRDADPANEHVGALRLADGVIVALPVELPGGLVAALGSWTEWSPQLRDWDPSNAEAVSDAVLLAPLRYPAKVICAGANYRKHITEMGAPGVDPDWKAWFFQKPPTTTVIGPTDDVLIDPDPSQQIDWEGELGVVIGTRCRNVSVAEAANVIAGYTVVNDVSARGPHYRATSFARPFDYDWLASKGQDTFCPIGPSVVPAWLVDPANLQLKLWVNDELKQNETTGDMILSCAELVAAASELVTLEPGDLIATGTPSGVGASKGTFLSHGDVVTVEITGLGRLRNRIQNRAKP